MANVGFIGLGVMGGPMAGHLLEKGHSVTVWGRTPERLEALRVKGAAVAPDPAALARSAETVFLCVNRDEDVDECVTGLLPGLVGGSLVVDHSTTSPTLARLMNERLAQANVGFLDAPVTGGSMGAVKGQLTIFAGGAESDFDRALPVMQAYAKRAERVGGPGAGQTMKIANQIAVGGALLALCESLSFAKKAGLDVSLTRDMLASGAAGSWAFENYGPKILAEDWSPGFSVKNQRKDFRYAIDEAQRSECAVPGTQLVDRLLARLDESGRSEWTTAALYLTLLESGFDPWTSDSPE